MHLFRTNNIFTFSKTNVSDSCLCKKKNIFLVAAVIFLMNNGIEVCLCIPHMRFDMLWWFSKNRQITIICITCFAFYSTQTNNGQKSGLHKNSIDLSSPQDAFDDALALTDMFPAGFISCGVSVVCANQHFSWRTIYFYSTEFLQGCPKSVFDLTNPSYLAYSYLPAPFAINLLSLLI